MTRLRPALRVAIACGGTGGHLFPGLAVGHDLVARGCEVSLLISPKDVDQQAVKGAARDFNLVTLPAVGLTGRNVFRFAWASARSYVTARREFRTRRPHAVLAMGGFTSAPPALAGRRCGAVTFLHESNTIPGRANRWLAHVVDECFIGFEETAGRLWNPRVTQTGTPVRPGFVAAEAAGARLALGLDPRRPVLLVMGGSQGASGLNELVVGALPQLTAALPELQVVHLTGERDAEAVKSAYAPLGRRARAYPFFSEMELLLAAATVAVSRSGASSLAELAAMRVPSVLVPFPFAVDDHQLHNARAFVAAGAACLLEQRGARPERLVELVVKLADEEAAKPMRRSLEQLDRPDAAARIAEQMLRQLSLHFPAVVEGPASVAGLAPKPVEAA